MVVGFLYNRVESGEVQNLWSETFLSLINNLWHLPGPWHKGCYFCFRGGIEASKHPEESQIDAAERVIMSLKKLLPVALVASAMFAATAAHALAIVTLNPQANNGGLGVVDATESAFQADGFLGSLGSVLNISGTTGVQTFSETGRIAVSDFQLANTNLNTNVASKYNIFADFTLTGSGAWTGNQFNATPAGAVLSFTLGADNNFDGIVDFTLGTGSLDPSFPAVAFALYFPPLGDLATPALTSFTATIDFTPAAGTEGAGGFFQAPTPFSIDIFAGNVGGTLNDTTYVINGDGSISITTVGGSGNFDFVQNRVPEPGSLALAGLALLGMVVAGRRKSRLPA